MAFNGGAASVVGQVMSIINQQASANAGQLTSAVNRAVALASQRASIAPPAALRAPVVPALGSLPTPPVPITGEAAALMTDLRDRFDALINQHFPNAASYSQQADTWIQRALTVGGTGISAVVEDQLWARERNRTLKESGRAADEAASAWAAKGYSMPPGALLHAQALIEQTAQDKLGESSRERAVKSIDAELENVRLAVTHTIELRTKAVSAAVQYIGVLIGAASTEVQKQQVLQSAYATLTNATVAAYQATLGGSELTLRGGIAQQQSDVEVLKAEANLITQNVGQAVQAAVAAVQAYAQMAGSALNGLHAQAAISGNDQTSTSVSTITNL